MNIELFKIDFLSFRLLDLAQVLLLSYFIYKILQLMRGTRSAQMLIGVFVLGILGFASYLLQLELLSWLFTTLATFGILALVVLFQPELRSVLANIGFARSFRVFTGAQQREIVEEVARAVIRLSELRYGGLMVIERRVGLREYIETGKSIGAKLSHEMIVTLFTPYTPLHDGAIIIAQGQLVAAACTLPLTQNALYRKIYGMRHKAGIGITEVSDAVAVMVSEETGKISLAQDGEFTEDIDRNDLRDALSMRLAR